MTPTMTDRFPPRIEHMLKTAQRGLERPADDNRQCAVCRSAFPRPQADLAAELRRAERKLRVEAMARARELAQWSGPP